MMDLFDRILLKTMLVLLLMGTFMLLVMIVAFTGEILSL